MARPTRTHALAEEIEAALEAPDEGLVRVVNFCLWHNPDLPGPAAVRQLSPQTRTFAPGKSASLGRGGSADQARDGRAGLAADPTPWGTPGRRWESAIRPPPENFRFLDLVLT